MSAGWTTTRFSGRYSPTTSGGAEYGPHEAYCFAGGPNHHAPVWKTLWWTEPDAYTCFFRPLSSYTLAFDHWFFADNALGAHLHSFVWFSLTLAGVYALGRRLFDPRVATIAIAIYGLANFSGSTVAWVASRHAIVTAALSALAIALYVAGREDRARRRAALGIVVLVVSLLAGEGALGGFAFLVAYEVIRSRDALKTRIAYVAIASMLAVVYLGFYSSLGFGANHGGYLDPLHAPGAFVAAVPGVPGHLIRVILGRDPSGVWAAA